MRHLGSPFLLALVALAVRSVAAQQPPSLAHARQLFEVRNYDAARSEYAALAQSMPRDATPALFLGRIAQAQRDDGEALRQFERCVVIDERNASCHFFIGEVLGTAAATTSRIKLPFLAKRARTSLERAVELDPDFLDARMGLIQYRLLAPGFLGGSVERAREQAAEIEKRSRLRGALAWGAIADRGKDLRTAEAEFLKAIAAEPDSAVGYNVLTNLYARQKRWDEAFATMERLLARRSEPSALLSLARLAATSGERLPRGEEAAKRWLARPPVNASPYATATAHARLGFIYERTGRRELARIELGRALALDPAQDDVKRELARIR